MGVLSDYLGHGLRRHGRAWAHPGGCPYVHSRYYCQGVCMCVCVCVCLRNTAAGLMHEAALTCILDIVAKVCGCVCVCVSVCEMLQ